MLRSNERFNPSNGKRSILVVDDEQINREVLEHILSAEYEVIQASDGDEAMEILCADSDAISLVLLDLMMPKINGLELLQIMKADGDLQHIPVIVMTADQSAEVESLRIGAVDFISKPYSQPEVILARVRRVIELNEDQQIIKSTERDALTGLYNRDYFLRYANQFDHHHKDTDMDAVVLDVNHFRMVNERYGKAHGDQVLRRISEKLKTAMRAAGGLVCRRGADTFLLYCPTGQNYQAILDAASISLSDSDSHSSANRLRLRMGIYPKVDKGIDMERRFDRAKLAADTLRDNYAQTVAYYDSTLHEKELYAEQLLEAFPAALEQRQFLVYYQPKFSIRPDQPVLASAEALVRWKHPDMGMISPGVFIPLLESKGLVPELDHYVWREVAAQIQDWKRRLGVSVPVSVNVSRVDMYDPGLVNHFASLMQEYHLSPTEYLLEITESAYTQDSDQIISTVNQLRDLGFRVEMDDFGTGYSSLNMLSTLPIDAMKLDMQFIRNAFHGERDLRLLELVIDIAKYLGVPTIAEGVETSEQLHALRALGCDYVQGFYFSRPVPSTGFEPFLLEWKARKAAPVSDADAVHGQNGGIDISRALSSGFESVYYVDAQSGHYVEFCSQGKYKELKIQGSGSDFFGDTQENLKRVIALEDQELVSLALSPGYLLDYLSKEDELSLSYRIMIEGVPVWYTLKASKAAGKGSQHLVIGIIRAEGSKPGAAKAQTPANRLGGENHSITRSLSSDFVAIYYVDTTDDSYQVFTAPGVYESIPMINTGTHFFDECRSNLQAMIYQEDQPKLIAALEKERLLKRLETTSSVVMDYRLMIQDEPVYYRLKVTRDDAHAGHIVIGVSDISEQRRQEQEYEAAQSTSVTYSLIAQALAQDYSSIYYVNVETEQYIRFSNEAPSHRLVPEDSGEHFFSRMKEWVQEKVVPEDQELLAIASDRDSLLREVADGQIYTANFRQIEKGKPRHINGKALMLNEDREHLVIGMRNIEAQAMREQEYEAAKAERTAYSRIAKALAQDYFSIYYVNIESDRYIEYSPTGRFQELKVVRRGDEFFRNIQDNMLMQVYREDHEKAASAWNRETILQELGKSNSFSASYRMLVNREPVYVSFKVIRMQDGDDKHIIIGISNIDAQVRREQEFVRAQEMALRDDLTRVKNKRAYSQAEQSMNNLIESGIQPEFAVVVCDVNELKKVNDTAGHNAGDQYIKNACSIICTVFAHSPVFRIGGDEFAAILQGRDYENRASLMKLINARSTKARSYSGKPLLACGIAEFDSESDTCIADVFRRADSAMYARKVEMKVER